METKKIVNQLKMETKKIIKQLNKLSVRKKIGIIFAIIGMILLIITIFLPVNSVIYNIIFIVSILCVIISLILIFSISFVSILGICTAILTCILYLLINLEKINHAYIYLFNILVIAIFLLLGAILLYTGYLVVKELNKSDDINNNVFIIIETVILIGLTLFIPSLLLIVEQIGEFFSKLGFKESLTGASVIITIVTCLIGAIVNLKINKDNEKKDRKINIHKEMDWRKDLHSLEMQDSYTIRDLVKLNSFFNSEYNMKNEFIQKHNKLKKEATDLINKCDEKEMRDFISSHYYLETNPSDKIKDLKGTINNLINSNYTKEELDNIDIELIDKIVEILKNHNIRPFEKGLNKRSLTLFDFELTKSDLYQPLNPKENQDIRKCIHKLLKNDWDIQTEKNK